MFPSNDRENSPGIDEDINDPKGSLIPLMKGHPNETNLETMRLSLLRTMAISSPQCLQDRHLLDSLRQTNDILIKSFLKAESDHLHETTNLASTDDVRSRINLWEISLEPWHEFLKNSKNLDALSSDIVETLLHSLPSVIKVIFSHCKRSESLYGPKFDDLKRELTSLYRRTDVLLGAFFTILDTKINFEDELENQKNVLEIALDKIADIAVLTNGMDLKTLINTWKAFAKLAAHHETLVKKSGFTECVTRRYADIAKDIETLLSLREKDANNERTIKCVALLLKILGRLCMLYRGYCGNKVSIALVQLLVKLYRYSPPFPSERFVPVQTRNVQYIETHIVPATVDLLNIILEEKEFSKAFFQHGKFESKEPICFHLLTLRIIEELVKKQQKDVSSWLQEDDNIIDVALSNANHCCADLLINELRIPVRSIIIFGDCDHMGIYEMTLRLLCRFISQTSSRHFTVVEITLLKHLLNGEFWSSLLSCDTWTYLGRISPPELCFEHLSFLLKVQKTLVTRDKSLEFEMISNLIGRLYKLLPNEMHESIIRQIEDYSNQRFIEPFKKSLSLRSPQYLRQHFSIDTTSNLAQIFQVLRRAPSMNNWNCLLKSIGVTAIFKDRTACIVTICDIWQFLASSISKSEGIIREMLLDLATILFDCTQQYYVDNSTNDRSIASIYESMLEVIEYLPIQHRLRINFFLRDNLVPYINESGKESLDALTELFIRSINDNDMWIRQESFETYAEFIVKCSSVELLDALSIGLNRSSKISRQMQLYLSNEKIHTLSHYSSLNEYLRELANSSRDRSTWHKCYKPDFRQRDEKMPRLESRKIDEIVDDVCANIQSIAENKNELSNSSLDKLRAALLQLLTPGEED